MIHRSLLEKCWAEDSAYIGLWVRLLLMAAWEDKQVMIHGQIINLKRGQLVVGRLSLSRASGISEKRIRTALKFFELDQQITIAPTNKYSIISITNYDNYQLGDEFRANRGPTEGQQRANRGPQNNKYNKLNTTPPTPPGSFERFWQAYPKKRSKGQAEKTWAKLKPTEQLVDLMVSKIELAKTSDEWTKDDKRYIPHPSTWLNAKGWEDELTFGGSDETDRRPLEKLSPRERVAKKLQAWGSEQADDHRILDSDD